MEIISAERFLLISEIFKKNVSNHYVENTTFMNCGSVYVGEEDLSFFKNIDCK